MSYGSSLRSRATDRPAHPVIRFCYNSSKNLFNGLSSKKSKQARDKKKSIVTSIAQAHDFVDMCALFGYYAEEHVVQTGDGYLLGLHRLGWKKGEEGTRVNAAGGIQKKVVYMHHGLLMNSEVWVCMTDQERCLPFALVEKGYDVWLGNNRGNKYSKKSTKHKPNTNAFWDFSMDEFAFHDIPDSINYILETTGQPSLSYVGFSQGTAQAFATLSIHPTLNDKVDVFIALAPAMSPAGLSNGVVDALVKASPEVIFLAFGRRMILSSATMWQQILYPPIFTRMIDMSLSFLFNWSGRNISPHQKLAAYPHLYSFTSTKSVVHWFQIIRTKCFQMYDDDVQAPLSLASPERYYKVAKFPTRNIKTPIVLVYGGSDSLVDIKVMLAELPRHTTAREIPHFEHLDFLWAQDVRQLVFPHVFRALDENAGRDHLATLKLYHHRSKQGHGRLPSFSTFSEMSEDDASSTLEDSEAPYGTPARSRRPGSTNGLPLHSPKSPQPPGLHTVDEASSLLDPRDLNLTQSSFADAARSGEADVNGRATGAESQGSGASLRSNTKEKRRGSRTDEGEAPSPKTFGAGGIGVGASKPTQGRPANTVVIESGKTHDR